MFRTHRFYKPRVILWLITLMLLASMTTALRTQAAPLPAEDAPTVTTVELVAVEDQGMIESVPTFIAGGAPYFVLNGRPDTSSEDWNFMQFDLSAIPADATIVGAQLKLDVIGFGGPPRQLEVGRIDGDWEEGVTSWSTMPPVTWGGPTQTITGTGDVTWPLKPLVEAWFNGTTANNGVAVRTLDNGNNAGAQARTKDGAGDLPPRLVIAYTTPADDGQPRPDLGDAPDSTNHHGINNTAYPGGILGQFPTVYNVPVGQPAGPRHDNQTMEGWLGNFLSREGEADLGPDQDAPANNILRNTVTGAVGDVADNDRGDDGWRNRNLPFYNCQRTQLEVRVSKAANATLKRMYLNVWFDGNRDGDWGDLGQCQRDEDQPAQAAYEWIVQNYIIDMTAVPAGGFLDFNIPTEKVLNSSGIGRHWMRFTLSEALAVQPASGANLPDGRGPHPQNPALSSFKYGETEDVVQKSMPAGEDGTLEIQKQVITTGEPTEWIDYVTYEIRLRHNGGTQPMQARMRDVLPYPLIVYPTINGGAIEYVTVESPTGGAGPLQAQLEVIPPSGSTPPQQVVKWQGSLAPNAEIKFTFQVRVLALCQPNQQTLTFTNTAQAKPQGGTVVTASDTFTAKCINYDESNVDVELAPIDNPNDWDDLIHLPISGTVHNLHPVTVTIGIYQKPLGDNVADIAASAVTTTTLPRKPIKLLEFPLKPGETKPFEAVLRMADESDEPIGSDSDPLAQLGYCIMLDNSGNCPDAALFPKLHGNVPISPTVRPSDLGDAPDSTNHFGAAMAAYPNTPAGFPTVFDPATGQPRGPRHLHPRPFHLGQRVSREIDADVGPDQDPLNNIIPPANDPDNDRFDDGSRLRNLANCQPAAADVQVAIAPIAVNYFQQLGTPAYLNIWIDSNRDGDWADGFTCQDAQGQNQAVVEHILIDYPINVVALGAGLHNLPNIATQRVPWPAQLANRPTWVRFTLSDRLSNKTLNFANMQYGDGRGYAQAFRVGETEDHYRIYDGNVVDLAVQLTANSQSTAKQEPTLQAATTDKLGNFEIQIFKVDVTNQGSAGVQGALLEFQIPEKLRGQQPIILRAPGVATESISFNFDKITMLLPFIEQDNLYSVVLGWYGCITCTVAADVSAANATVDYTGIAKVTANGDSDDSNNQSSATARGLLSSPLVGAFMDYTDDSCMDHIVTGQAATNRTTLALRGRAAPNQIIAILIGLLKAGETTSDANGNFSFTANLTPGVHVISAKYANQVQSAGMNIVSPRDPQSGLPTGKLRVLVNPALPYDPISACFTDSTGRSIFMPMLGIQLTDILVSSIQLKAGETYRLSVYGNGNRLNAALDAGFTIADDLINEVIVKDVDGDGLFTGMVTVPNTLLQAAAQEGASVTQATPQFVLRVTDGATENSFSSDVTLAGEGIVSDRATGQPVANTAVAALLAQSNGAGVSYTAPASATLGQPNPATTATNGAYSFSVANGIYRLDVLANGYQPYRSGDIAVADGLLAQNIALTPAIAEAATQRVAITENGFQPATLNAKLGDVIEFVNVDLDGHSATGSAWDSGLLAAGQSYKVKVTTNGTFSYADSTGSLNGATIIVGDGAAPTGNALYLPLVRR